MTDVINIPLQNAYETELSSSITSSATSITVDTAPSFTLPAGQAVYGVIDPNNSAREAIKITATSGNTLTVVRAQADSYGGSGTARSHSGGAKVIISDNFQIFTEYAAAINGKIDTADGALTAYADATARDAAITSPENGMQCYLTDQGKFYDYTAGSWVERASGGTFSNASETEAGKVEVATAAELAAGTGTGGTGAKIVVTPANTAIIDDSAGAADAGKWGKLDINGRYKASMVHLDSESLEDDGSDNVQVKLDPAGGIAKSASGLAVNLPGIAMVAGENIDGSSTPVAISAGGSAFKRYGLTGFTAFDWNSPDGDADVGDADSGAWRAVKITPDSGMSDATVTIEYATLYLNKTSTPTDDWRIEIYSDDGAGLPDTLITNGTSDVIAGGSIDDVSCPVRFAFSTPPEVTAGTDYWVVLKRSGAVDAAKYMEWEYEGTSAGASANYTASLTSWAATTQQLVTLVQYNADYDGKAFKADADDLHKSNYVGFTTSNVSATESLSLLPYGQVTSSGLTAGDDYFLDTTAGAITNSITIQDDVPAIKVAKALTDTGLMIQSEYNKRFYGKFDYFRFVTPSGPAATQYLYVPVEVGFEPSEIEIFAKAELGAGASDAAWHGRYFRDGDTVTSAFTALDGSSLAGASYDNHYEHGYLGASADFAISVEEIFQNGFLLKVSSNLYMNSVNWRNVYYIAKA